MLGGGTFTVQNKKLPGSYINFISKDTGRSVFSERGYVAYAHSYGWGEENKIVEITSEDLAKDSVKYFGLEYSDPELRPIREIFRTATVLYTYKLKSGGTKAGSSFATAVCGGAAGNKISVKVSTDLDDESKYNVDTFFSGTKVDTQTVANASELEDNDYVTFKKSASLSATMDESVQNTIGTLLTGGTDGTVSAGTHAKFMSALESYPSVNVIAYDGEETVIKNQYAAWAVRMRERVGIKVQAVVSSLDYDSEAVVNVVNTALLVPWAAGVEAGFGVNESATNYAYDGELTEDELDAGSRSQSQLEECIDKGRFVVHLVDGTPRILEDINSLITLSDAKGAVFQDNKTIRIIDQIARDIAGIFNTTYLGNVANDEAGRLSFKNQIINEHRQLESLRAIQNFSDDDVDVAEGSEKNAVSVTDAINVTGTMTKLYMIVTVG